VIFETHELADGTRVRLRLARPSDSALMQAFLDDAPDAAAHDFTFYDLHQRLIMIATTLGPGGEEIVGLASVTFLRGGLAEVAVLVREEARGRGLGTLLTGVVAAEAVRRGATRLKGEAPMLPLLERVGRTVQSVEDGRAVAYTRLSRAPRRRRAA
jgi:GNAT superfamily N-acetyltransferase